MGARTQKLSDSRKRQPDGWRLVCSEEPLRLDGPAHLGRIVTKEAPPGGSLWGVGLAGRHSTRETFTLEDAPPGASCPPAPINGSCRELCLTRLASAARSTNSAVERYGSGRTPLRVLASVNSP